MDTLDASRLKHGVVFKQQGQDYIIYSKRTGTFYRQFKNHDYYKEYYHTHKKEIECPNCGRCVYSSSFRRHTMSEYCKKKTLEKKEKEEFIKKINNEN